MGSFIVPKILVIFRSNWFTGIKWSSCRPCFFFFKKKKVKVDMHDMRHGDLHSIGVKLAYTDTQLKVLKYAMKQNSDILWYPIKNVDTQFTKKPVHIYPMTSNSYLELCYRPWKILRRFRKQDNFCCLITLLYAHSFGETEIKATNTRANTSWNTRANTSWKFLLSNRVKTFW